MTNFMTKIAAQTCYHFDSGRISTALTVMLTKDNRVMDKTENERLLWINMMFLMQLL